MKLTTYKETLEYRIISQNPFTRDYSHYVHTITYNGIVSTWMEYIKSKNYTELL